MIPETVIIGVLAGMFLVGLGSAMTLAASMGQERHRFRDSERLKLVLKSVGASAMTFGVLSWIVIIGGALWANSSGDYNPALSVLLVPLVLFFGAVGLSGLSAIQSASFLGTDMTDMQVAQLERMLRYLKSAGLCMVVLGFISPLLPAGALIVAFIVASSAVSGGNLRGNQGALLWLLVILVEKDMPLADEVDALAESFSGSYRLRVKKLAEALHHGEPLSSALRRAPRLVPQHALIAADIGDKTGTLGPSLREAAERHGGRISGSGIGGNTSLGGLVLYWVVVFSLLLQIFAFLMYSIAPKFKKIFADFGLTLPQVTEWLFGAGSFTSYYYILGSLMLVPLVAVCVLAYAQFVGWEYIRTGWFGRFFLRLDTPTVLRSLAQTVALKQPLDFGVECVVDGHRRSVVRSRLNEVYYSIKSGNDCWDAMRRQRFITRQERSVLQSAQRAGNLAWALAELAETIERRLEYRLRQVVEALQPVAVFSIGLAVLFICLGFFMPIVKLIQSLA